MKIAATLLAVAAASGANSASVVNDNCMTKEGNVVCWESYFQVKIQNGTNILIVDQDTTEGECGLHYETGESMVNSTCVLSSSADADVMVGNGGFVTSDGLITGFDGVSGTVNAVATWATSGPSQQWVQDHMNLTTMSLVVDNTTEFNHQDCFTTGLNQWIDITCTDNGAPSVGPAIMMTNNSPGAENTFAIANYGAKGDSLTVIMNVGCDPNAITSPMGDISGGMDWDCSFSITVTDDAPQLLYFTATTTEKVNFFEVTITSS